MRKSIYIIFFILMAGAVHAQDARPDALKEYRARNYQGAVNICLNEIATNAYTGDTYAVLLWSYNRLRQYRNTISYGQQALQRYRDMRVIEAMGEACYYLGDYTRAMENFKTYARELPEGAFIDDVCYFMGEIYIRNKEYNNADIALSAAVHYYPRSTTWWTRLGYAREQAGSYAAALAAYDEALNLNRSNADAAAGRERVRIALNP